MSSGERDLSLKPSTLEFVARLLPGGCDPYYWTVSAYLRGPISECWSTDREIPVDRIYKSVSSLVYQGLSGQESGSI